MISPFHFLLCSRSAFLLLPVCSFPSICLCLSLSLSLCFIFNLFSLRCTISVLFSSDELFFLCLSFPLSHCVADSLASVRSGTAVAIHKLSFDISVIVTSVEPINNDSPISYLSTYLPFYLPSYLLSVQPISLSSVISTYLRILCHLHDRCHLSLPSSLCVCVSANLTASLSVYDLLINWMFGFEVKVKVKVK